MTRRVVSTILFLALPAFAARKVKDELGREVTVPDHPHRLVCLMPNVVDDVYALGVGSAVIAVPDFTKYPSEAKTKPSIGLPLNPSIETIVSLHPDLVLANGELNRMATVDELEKFGIPVFVVNPHGVEGIYKSIQSLGRALNLEKAAERSVSTLREREARVRQRAQGRPNINVLMLVWYDPIVTAGKDAYITELIQMAGGHSIAADIPEEWPEVSLEFVLARAPDALLIVRGSKVSLDAIRTRPGWRSVPAIKNNRIYFVDDRIEYPSPVAFDAFEDLVNQFHP